jgi:predicted negative regulator of RcsB-dependent stress response
MSENLFEAQYDVTKKSKIKKFYDSNKILIFSTFFILIVVFISIGIYLDNKKSKRVELSENYLQAKFYLESDARDKAINILKETVFANDPTYSTLSFFLIMNQNLISNLKELNSLFDHLLEENKFSDEFKDLLIFKKALLNSNNVDEIELLAYMKPILNSESIWKPHCLLLIGDYFVSKGENLKGQEFYQKVFTIKNLHIDLYNHAKAQLAMISNE